MGNDLLQAETGVQALIVDSDPAERALLAATIAPLGCHIAEAEDGREALCKAVVLRPDLLVTGVQVPLIDGPALCELFRADRDLRSTVVIVTSDNSPADIARAQRAGANSVLVKPFAPEDIAAVTKSLIARSRELRNRIAAVQASATSHLRRSQELVARAAEQRRRGSRTYSRYDTTSPPNPPPALRCPKCDVALTYEVSHVGGVNQRASEQWDEFRCITCGVFEYRHRTRRLRLVSN